MIENFGGTGIAEYVLEDFPTLTSDLLYVGLLRIGLLQIGSLEPTDRSERVFLRITRKPPGADRGTQQMQRAFDFRYDSPQQYAIQLAEHQPLGAAGRAKQCAD